MDGNGKPFPNRPEARVGSGQVHCEALEVCERAMVQGALVGGAQDHAGRLARLKGFLPTRRTKAPTVTRFQALKADFGDRC